MIGCIIKKIMHLLYIHVFNLVVLFLMYLIYLYFKKQFCQFATVIMNTIFSTNNTNRTITNHLLPSSHGLNSVNNYLKLINYNNIISIKY